MCNKITIGWCSFLTFITIFIIAFLLVCLLACFYSYVRAFYSNPQKRGKVLKMPGAEQYRAVSKQIDVLIKAIDSLSFEEVSIVSFDGLKLYAKYYHVSDDAPIHIECHGYKGKATRDFCGGNKLARVLGHNVLLIDQRAHGKSGGHTITFGIKERYDVLGWIRYLNDRFGTQRKIILSGVSMGAATVLMMSNMDLPDNVACIIADSPYSSPREIIKKVCEDMKLPPKIAMPFIKLGGIIFGRFNIDECSPVESVKNSKKPILIIHGEEDLFVPCQMSKTIFDNCTSEKQHIVFKGAGHGLSYLVSPLEYEKASIEFINKYI